MNPENAGKVLNLLVATGKLSMDDISRAEHILETFSDPTPKKVGRKPTGTAVTNSQRQTKWKKFNRETALARQREAMKKLRAKKKASQ